MDSSGVQSAPADKRSGSNPALVVGLIVIGVAALALGGYAVFKAGGLQKPTDIGEITANIRDWDGKAVTIEGTVSAPLNIVVAKMYRLTDDTGEILVVTEKGLPADGEAVRVDGYVKQAFKVGTMEQTIVFEPASGATADE